MINLRKHDPIADAVKEILQQEALKGNQHLIDKNKNNKVDAHDFKILRGEKKSVKEGMEALAKAGREGKALDPVRAKYDKYDDEQVDENMLGQLRDRGNVVTGQKQQDRKNFDTNTGAPLKANSTISGIRARMQNKVQLNKEEVESVEEGIMNAVKNLASKASKALTGGSDEDQRKDLQRKMGVPQTGKKPTKEEVEELDESFRELTSSKHGSFSVNSKVTSPKEGFHKGQHVGMVTLVHKGTIQHKDNSKPSKFEIHNHVNRGLIFQTHHSDEEKQAIKQHLVKNKMAGKATEIYKEEVEELDELSKSTLGSYVKKASLNRSQLSYGSGLAASRGVTDTKGIEKDSQRAKGISKAVGRLTGEEVQGKTLKQFMENAFDYKTPRKPEPNGGSGVKQGSAYGGSKQKDKPEQATEKK